MSFRSHFWCGCLLLVAMAGMWEGGQGQGQEQERELLSLNLDPNMGDLCGKADYPVLCRSVVRGLSKPSVALESAIRQLMLQTKMARTTAKRLRKSPGMEVCSETYKDAFGNLKTCLSTLKTGDKPTLNINLSAALTGYVTCDDAVAERGGTSPVTRTNLTLRQMATNCLYLSSLIGVR